MTAMDEQRYRTVFAQFLNGYWGAFHELLEAESVTPARLAGSLFDHVVEQHRQFAETCPPELMTPVETLGRLWQGIRDHRVIVPDDPVTPQQVREALGQFQAIYDGLFALGRGFPGPRAEVLSDARHAHPRAPLRADAAP
jgi:hypothetical protein